MDKGRYNSLERGEQQDILAGTGTQVEDAAGKTTRGDGVDDGMSAIARAGAISKEEREWFHPGAVSSQKPSWFHLPSLPF